jgi:hypothetical protein
MKKLFFIILISIGFLTSHAQKLQLGLKLSPQFVWIKTDNPEIMDNNGLGLGLSYGGIANYFFRDNYGLNFEICHNIIQFSTGYKDSSGNMQYVKWKQQYIEIPIAIKMQTNEMGVLKYFGKFGINPMIKASAQLNDVNNTTDINFFNANVLIGAGVIYAIGGTTEVFGGITYHNGIMRMNNRKKEIFADHHLDDGIKNVQLKPSYISLDIGILF